MLRGQMGQARRIPEVGRGEARLWMAGSWEGGKVGEGQKLTAENWERLTRLLESRREEETTACLLRKGQATQFGFRVILPGRRRGLGACRRNEIR